MESKEIYNQTQQLARLIMKQRGFYSDFPITHRSVGRTSDWWKDACEIQEFLFNHEMSDVIDEYEEQFETTYIKLTDKEALTILAKDGSVWVNTPSSGNEDGFKEIANLNIFLEKCYQYCTVYKQIKS